MSRIKFKDMPYVRPDLAAVKAALADVTERLASATTYQEAKDAFLAHEKCHIDVTTMGNLAYIRHSIDTRDEFYKAESDFWNVAGPEIQASESAWRKAKLASAFRPQLEEEFGAIDFLNDEIQERAFCEAIVADLQDENRLVNEYSRLIASAQVAFEGGTYTISQLSPFKNDADDARRLAAWKAEGAWYKEHQADLDRIYDGLVHVRDTMGRKLGHENYRPMGYDRMLRNCYGKTDVEQFRAAVVKYLVPVSDSIYRAQAERLGVPYPLSFADAALMFRSGNPRPQGTPDDILAQGKRFYDELSPESSEFFRRMLEQDLLDVLSTPGKEAGGYCESLYAYRMPFIFANFNGTQHDVEVITHEAGHAFAGYLNRDRIPVSTIWPTMESCEVHSMSMEFFAWPWCEGFFGPDTRKYLYSHLAGAITFIPYGTMVDHFQHVMYEQPNLTPAERHGVWRELLGTYMPWLRLDGDIPFYADGEGWQRQLHIYGHPFYYIDYCLAQTVALEFWAKMQEDRLAAWEQYMAYSRLGGSMTFVELLETAGLVSPFNEACLRGVCETASAWLSAYDLTGIA